MNNQPNPEDIEYLTQLTYSSIPPERIILIEPHWFDLEILALWIRINPSNPLTRAQLTNFDIWSIIINYNNYVDSEEPVLTETPRKFNYTENPSFISGSTGEVVYDDFILKGRLRKVKLPFDVLF